MAMFGTSRRRKYLSSAKAVDLRRNSLQEGWYGLDCVVVHAQRRRQGLEDSEDHLCTAPMAPEGFALLVAAPLRLVGDIGLKVDLPAR